MKTGYYNINKLSTVDLKEFFKEAIMLSYSVHLYAIDCDISYKQARKTTNTIQFMIDNISSSNHNICIDRSIQNGELGQYGEIGYCKVINDFKYFLYLNISLENLKELTTKYNLIMT